jgi:hypothetical protein
MRRHKAQHDARIEAIWTNLISGDQRRERYKAILNQRSL